MRFIGVDPGKATGLCSFNVVDNAVASVDHWQLDHIGVSQYFENLRDARNAPTAYIGPPEDPIIAMESFIVTPGSLKKNFQSYSLETIGSVRYFVETAGLALRFSAPSAHKKLVTDSVLKAAGLWFPGEGHACDAARVALHVCIVDHKLLQWALKGEDD